MNYSAVDTSVVAATSSVALNDLLFAKKDLAVDLKT